MAEPKSRNAASCLIVAVVLIVLLLAPVALFWFFVRSLEGERVSVESGSILELDLSAVTGEGPAGIDLGPLFGDRSDVALGPGADHRRRRRGRRHRGHADRAARRVHGVGVGRGDPGPPRSVPRGRQADPRPARGRRPRRPHLLPRHRRRPGVDRAGHRRRDQRPRGRVAVLPRHARQAPHRARGDHDGELQERRRAVPQLRDEPLHAGVDARRCSPPRTRASSSGWRRAASASRPQIESAARGRPCSPPAR